MLVYITGPSGSGKTTLLKRLSIPGYDLDDIYEANWKKHRKVETVQAGVKKDVAALIAKHKTIIFVGLQSSEQLPFVPDRVFLLARKDTEQYYRDKLVRDLNLLCRYKADFEKVLAKEPFSEFRNHFWSNDVVGMKGLEEFKLHTDKMTAAIKADFPKAEICTADEIYRRLRSF